MKYLETSLTSVDVISLPVGKQNDIAYKTGGLDKHTK